MISRSTASNSRVNICLEGTGRDRFGCGSVRHEHNPSCKSAPTYIPYTRCLSAALWRPQLCVHSYTIPFVCPSLRFRKMWANSSTMRAAVSCVLTVCVPVADGARGAANFALAVGTTTTSNPMNPVASCPRIPTVLREGPRSWWVVVGIYR